MIFRRCEEFPPHRSLRKQIILDTVKYIAVLWMTIRGSIIFGLLDANSDPLVLNYGSGSGSLLFIKDLGKKFRKSWIFYHFEWFTIYLTPYFFNWAQKCLGRIRIRTDPLPVINWPPRSGFGTLGQNYSSVDPDPKKIYMDPLPVINWPPGSGFGTLSQNYSSVDPDPKKIYMDPQHWRKG
jgi:hypothetical protein